MVHADHAQMRQIVLNLITNASDALGERPGRIVVRTGVRDMGSSELSGPASTEALPGGRYARARGH